jgi:hypothetical protein
MQMERACSVKSSELAAVHAATSKLAAASLEVRFYYKNGRFLTEKGQNLTFLRIFLHAIIG